MLNGRDFVEYLEDDFKISYKKGEKLSRFIDQLVDMLPEVSYNYNTSKETYIRDNIKNILEVAKDNE